MYLRLILCELIASPVRARIVDALLRVRIQLVESGVGSYVDGAVESFCGVLTGFSAYQCHVPGELVKGERPLLGLTLHSSTLVFHEDHLLHNLQIAILDITDGPVGTLLGDSWKHTRFLLDAVL